MVTQRVQLWVRVHACVYVCMRMHGCRHVCMNKSVVMVLTSFPVSRMNYKAQCYMKDHKEILAMSHENTVKELSNC